MAIPKIASNIFPSWANGFFFLAASEIISLGNVKYELKGIGSRIVRLIANNDYMGLYIALTFSALLSVLLTELIFRPLLIWSEKYKLETIAKPMPVTEVWLGRLSLRRVRRIGRRIALKVPSFDLRRRVKVVYYPKLVKGFSSAFKVLVPVSLISFLMLLIIASKDFRDALMLLTELNYLKYTALALIYSTLRILATSLLTMCWIIPLAFYLYFRPKLERLTLLIFQVLASIPAPLFYPVILKVFKGSLIELGVILMLMLASQWYLFYNIYDGLKRFPYELEEVLNLYRVKGLYKLKVALVPAIMPSLFTGLVTFIGGCWNALVIAEELRPGVGVNIGIGKELISYTNAGYLPGLYATLLIMVLFIMGLNKGLWRPLRDYIMNRFSYEA
ncbi:MAG: hypothetical protein B6U69_02610 [Thermofilum sp. ex4484_15]|nr:MAG: hypothetical protein B6U69_02610 [Thermofilum sp. ex4484_15]